MATCSLWSVYHMGSLLQKQPPWDPPHCTGCASSTQLPDSSMWHPVSCHVGYASHMWIPTSHAAVPQPSLHGLRWWHIGSYPLPAACEPPSPTLWAEQVCQPLPTPPPLPTTWQQKRLLLGPVGHMLTTHESHATHRPHAGSSWAAS